MITDKELITETIAAIAPSSAAAAEAAQARLDSLTKPQGSLGRLEDLAKQLAAITHRPRPEFRRKVIFTLAADHGVAAEGVSAFPQEVTAQMVLNFLRGGAAINVLARQAGVEVIVADLGVANAYEVTPAMRAGYRDRKIAAGTANMALGPAMTRAQAEQAVATGMRLVAEEAAAGMDLAGTGEMGIANTTASTAIGSVLTGRSVEELSGFGTGLSPAGLEKKIAVIKRALEVNRPDPADAFDVLAKVGGFEIGGLAGVILGAAARRIPVVVDGFISTAAALVAVGLAPAARAALISSHVSAERGHAALLHHLELQPSLSLGMRLGEGTGAALGMMLCEAATRVLNEMATFAAAAVSNKSQAD